MAEKCSAVFMDRDGTINEEVSYLSRMEQLRLYPQSDEAIRLINAAGMKAVVVTNQSGIARGYFTEDFVRSVHERINELLRGRRGPHRRVLRLPPPPHPRKRHLQAGLRLPQSPNRGCCCRPPGR